MSTPKISGSVGAFSAGARNHNADVEKIQELLDSAAKKTGNAAYDPQGVDGKIARPPRTSNTVKAIDAFQKSFMAKPDLLIEPGKTTFQKLVAYWDGDEDFLSSPLIAQVIGAIRTSLGLAEKPSFPLKFVPRQAYWGAKGHGRKFGAKRNSWSHKRGHADRKWLGFRRHAGCDLIAPVGTEIFAVASGRVVSNPATFYLTSQSVVIQHEGFQARYCEFAAGTCKLRIGDTVSQGQLIGKVAQLHKDHMLHFEMYSGTSTAPWSRREKPAKTLAKAPYRRRADLIDPTPYLKMWESNIPK